MDRENLFKELEIRLNYLFLLGYSFEQIACDQLVNFFKGQLGDLSGEEAERIKKFLPGE